MNQLHEAPSEDAVKSGHNPSALGKDIEPAAEAAGVRVHPFSHAESGPLSEKGRVMLIEANPFFRESIRDCLIENAYTVLDFHNSRDALKQVLTGDFALVFFDPTTPGIPVDKFYQGLRRIDSELCARLVFLIGDRNDATTSAFIRKVDGFVQRKPFDAKTLTDRIAAIEVLGSLQGAFESASGDTGLSQDCLSVSEGPAAGAPYSGGIWSAEAPSPEPVQAQTAPAMVHESLPARRKALLEQLAEIPAADSEAPSSGVFRSIVFVGLALLFVLIMARWTKERDARVRAATEASKREAAQADWTVISLEQSEAADARTTSGEHASASAGTVGNRALPQWSPSVRSLIASVGSGIELLEIRARPHKENEGIFELEIRGVASGAQPRLLAEEFRAAAEVSLKTNANARLANIRIESFGENDRAYAARQQSSFLMIATVSLNKAPIAPIAPSCAGQVGTPGTHPGSRSPVAHGSEACATSAPEGRSRRSSPPSWASLFQPRGMAMA